MTHAELRRFVIENRDRFSVLNYPCYASPQHKYVYVATGKVASTKIKADLHVLEGYELPEHLGDLHDRNDPERKFVASVAQLEIDEAIEALNSPQWLRFCFVRNPYSRLYSAYRSKILNWREAQYQSLQQAIRDRFDYPVRDGRASGLVTFRDFVRFVAEAPSEEWDGHWALQVHALKTEVIPYDVIGRVEEFESKFAGILGRLDAPGGLLESVSERRNSSPRIYLASVYDRELAAEVHNLYEADFEAFGYEEDSWLFDYED